MAKIRTRTSGNVPISSRSDNRTNIGNSSGMPKYVGASAVVDRVENGVRITLTDYKGTTQEIVYESIQEIIQNADGSLTFVMPDGRTYTTDSLIGPKGDKGDNADLPMYFATEEEWASQTSLVSELNAIYVYTDHKQVGDQNIAGFKIGDGLAYVVDLPFTDALMDLHMQNNEIHVTAEERAFWNAKNRGFVNGENLILTDL